MPGGSSMASLRFHSSLPSKGLSWTSFPPLWSPIWSRCLTKSFPRCCPPQSHTHAQTHTYNDSWILIDLICGLSIENYFWASNCRGLSIGPSPHKVLYTIFPASLGPSPDLSPPPTFSGPHLFLPHASSLLRAKNNFFFLSHAEQLGLHLLLPCFLLSGLHIPHSIEADSQGKLEKCHPGTSSSYQLFDPSFHFVMLGNPSTGSTVGINTVEEGTKPVREEVLTGCLCRGGDICKRYSIGVRRWRQMTHLTEPGTLSICRAVHACGEVNLER